MAKTKAVADAKDKAGPAPTEKRPALEQVKAGGPQRLQRALMPAAGGAAAMAPAGGPPPPGAPGRARTMGALQRTIGNARLARMAEPPPTASAVGGANGKHRPIQTKLAVGPADDPFEREADVAASRIAAGQPVQRISRLSGSGIASAHRKCATCGTEMEQKPAAGGPVQRKCTACEQEEKAQRQPERQPRDWTPEDEKKRAAPLQTKAAGTAGSEPGLDTERAEQAMSRAGPGSPLAPAMRARMEGGFGADFAGVRVHTGAAADEASRAVNARAFTRGSDIYLARGESASDPRLMAHELTHTVQQTQPMVQRDVPPPAPSSQTAGPVAMPPVPAAQPAAKVPPVPRGEIVKSLDGVQLVEDEIFMRYQLEQLVTKNGSGAPRHFLWRLEQDYQTDEMAWDRANQNRDPRYPPAAGVPHSQEEIDAYDRMKAKELKVLALMRPIVDALDQERSQFIADFETQARANIEATLNTSEDTAKTEAVKYGLTEQRYSMGMGGTFIKYHMQTGTSVAEGIKAAAGVLLGRRQEIANKKREQLSATHLEQDPTDFKGAILVPDEPRFSELGRMIQERREAYELVRSALVPDYPVLGPISGLDKDTDALETVAQKGGGDETAKIIGEEIAERLKNIKEVRENLNDKSEVNPWQLPPVVEVTSKQLGADVDNPKKRWITEQVSKEQPGILRAIALGLFNLLALALAPVTGGISLAVAAGVNVIATAQEVSEYFMKKALAGTHFTAAQALSHEDPSLLWLAVSIIGTAVDVGAAAQALKSFRALAPLAKAAKTAKSGEEAEKAIAALGKAAADEGGPDVAKRVIASARSARGGETAAALEAAGLTTAKETEALKAAGRIVEDELKAGVLAEARTATGSIKVSRSGHIFSCTSPCQWLREKHAAIIGTDGKIQAELTQLETKAAAAAQEAKLGNRTPLSEIEGRIKALDDELSARGILGTDPKRGYIPHEGEVGAEIQGRYGGFSRDPTGAGEWISMSGPYKGKTFDLLGIPPGKAQFHSPQLEKFLPSVDSHFLKSVEYVVLDTRNMTAAQKATLMNYINTKWAAQMGRLIIL